MRVYHAELKRQLKTRSVRLLLLFALVMTFVLAYCPISFVQFVYAENGQEILVKGPKAISMRKEAWKDYAGEMTGEKLAEALQIHKDCFEQYGNPYYYMPDSEYCQKLAPIEKWMYRLAEAYSDPATDEAPSPLDRTKEDALNFYQKYSEYFDASLEAQLSGHPEAIRQAKALQSHTKLPFSYYPGFNTDALDYQILLTLMLTIVGALIAAPIFSSDYQTGSDNILRCAKYGKKPLALAKITATLTITSILYLVCMTIYLLIEGFVFGWDCLKTSVQFIWMLRSLPPINYGQLMLLSAVFGFLSFLATIMCVLFLSARCRSVYASSSLSLLLCILPILTSSFLPEKVDLWIRFFLPDGGIGFSNSFLYEVLFLNFLHLGKLSLWYPYALTLSCLLGIPIWLLATVRAYQTHRL